jgi:hypothetical protein
MQQPRKASKARAAFSLRAQLGALATLIVLRPTKFEPADKGKAAKAIGLEIASRRLGR